MDGIFTEVVPDNQHNEPMLPQDALVAPASTGPAPGFDPFVPGFDPHAPTHHNIHTLGFFG